LKGTKVFERFTGAYPLDAGEASPPENIAPLRQVPGLAELVTLAAGLSFGNGILRVFTDDEARDPATGSVYALDGTIPDLFDEYVLEDPDTFLAQHLFTGWRALHPERNAPGTCVGFKRPLFLGGAEAVENLEVVDEEVYWSVHGQLWAKVKDLPEGTSISGVEIS
jgi:hypothetical protein